MPKLKENCVSLRESIIQKKTIKAFEDAGWFVVKIIQTNRNGFPDLQCLQNGKIVFIECKREDKKANEPLQLYRHSQLRKQGFLVKVINNINQIQDVINQCSFIL
jgi:hypothetical protein